MKRRVSAPGHIGRSLGLLVLLGLAQGCGGGENGPGSSADRGGTEAEGEGVAATGPTIPPPDISVLALWRFELIGADRDWNASLRGSDVDPWLSFFAPDGSLILEGTGVIQGQEALRAWMEEGTSSSTLKDFNWAPLQAEPANAGDMGFTTGRFRMLLGQEIGPDINLKGPYMTLWRRQEDGLWKAEIMMATPDEETLMGEPVR